jgi:RNase P subunit RPR2
MASQKLKRLGHSRRYISTAASISIRRYKRLRIRVLRTLCTWNTKTLTAAPPTNSFSSSEKKAHSDLPVLFQAKAEYSSL